MRHFPEFHNQSLVLSYFNPTALRLCPKEHWKGNYIQCSPNLKAGGFEPPTYPFAGGADPSYTFTTRNGVHKYTCLPEECRTVQQGGGTS